jgi:hypothetical protein
MISYFQNRAGKNYFFKPAPPAPVSPTICSEQLFKVQFYRKHPNVGDYLENANATILAK